MTSLKHCAVVNAQECAEMGGQMDHLLLFGVTIGGTHYSNYHIWGKLMREFSDVLLFFSLDLLGLLKGFDDLFA